MYTTAATETAATRSVGVGALLLFLYSVLALLYVYVQVF